MSSKPAVDDGAKPTGSHKDKFKPHLPKVRRKPLATLSLVTASSVRKLVDEADRPCIEGLVNSRLLKVCSCGACWPSGGDVMWKILFRRMSIPMLDRL